MYGFTHYGKTLVFRLRKYQGDCIKAVVDALELGMNKQLCVLPTGAGKTVVASHLPKFLKPRRVLFLAHREELLDQAAETFKKVFPKLSIGKEIGESKGTLEDHIVVGSVPTLGKKNHLRLRKLFGDNPENILLITDEAHHATANSYRNIYKFFNLIGQTDTTNTHIGITATPFRGDNANLTDIFDDITYMKKLGDMILEGWLVDVKSHHIHTQTDLSQVRTHAGDYAVKQLAAAVNTPERNQLIVNTYMHLAEGKKAVAFCVDVAHAISLNDEFNNAGIISAVVTGATPKKERRDIIKRFKKGHLRVITNCAVLTEGFDAPDTEVIIIARPTRSPVLYTQMLGRGMRLAEGKDHMLLLDLYDRTKNPPVHMDRVLNVPMSQCTYGEWKAVKEVIEEEYPYAPPDDIARAVNAIDANDIIAKLQGMDILEVLVKIYEQGIDSFISSKTKLSWSKLADGSYQIQSAGIGKIAIRVNAMGSWELWRKEPRKPWNKPYTGDPVECFKRGDKIIADYDKTKLYLRSAPWKRAPATKKQLDLIKRLTGKPPSVAIDSKGKAAHLINSLFEAKQK